MKVLNYVYSSIFNIQEPDFSGFIFRISLYVFMDLG